MGLSARLGNVFANLGKTAAGVGKVGGSVVGTVGKAGIKTASKVGNKMMDGVEAFVKADKREMVQKAKNVGKAVSENVLTNDESYRQVGKSGLRVSNKLNLLDEVATHTRAAGNFAYTAGSKMKLLKRTDDSILGVKATKLGVGVAMVGAGLSGIPRAGREFNEERRGMSDGQVTGHAPMMPMSSGSGYTPAYQQHAGATGDLVFALNDMRRG